MVQDYRGWHHTTSHTTISFLLLLGYGCGQVESPIHEPDKSALIDSVTIMKLESSGFKNGEKLDAKYTVEGQDVSPPLAWSSAPADTKSLALICDDPDAPSPRRPADEPWVHWIIFNIPADRSELPEGVHRDREPADVPTARQGVNSWSTGNLGYRGPAPPPGSGPHRYFFKIYALDKTLDLVAGATKKQLLAAMSGHVLGEGQLIGTYER